MDPVHAAILDLAAQAPLGHVIDLGCGRGQMGVALLEAGSASSILAIDRDAPALRQLCHAADGLPLRTQVTDLSQGSPVDQADTILLVDVLYQLPTATQFNLLRQAASLARRMIIIRTMDPAPGWRTTLNAKVERLGRGRWPTFGERANPLPPADLAAALASFGFTVQIRPCAQGTPHAGKLLVGQRV
jgi:2-polyprenyl-3-methyl-5-hydroxy-6-metoxy-1,4-benzoquinol methylase